MRPRSEVYITAGLGPWDVAAGMLFVREAGGQIVDYNGNNYNNSQLFKEKLIKIVAKNKKIKLGKIKF